MDFQPKIAQSRFYKDWTNACETMRNQFRVTCYNGVHGELQVSNWFYEHGKRMIDERWPEFKEETA